MRASTILSLLLLTTVLATADTPAFLLGIDYTQWLLPNVQKLATDNSGAIYILSNANSTGSVAPPSTVTKLSPDGKTIVWQNQLGFPVSTMAVDPNGGVYVSPLNPDALTSALTPGMIIAKLKDGGSGIAWQIGTGLTFPSGALPTLAADSLGRVYVAGLGTFLRIRSDGSAVDYQQPLVGIVNSIAVDASGAAFVVGGDIIDGSLARFGPDGAPGFYTRIATNLINATVMLDLSGNPVIFANGVLTRFDTTGAVTSSKQVISFLNPSWVAGMDRAGNVYLLGNPVGSGLATLPVKNSLAACSSTLPMVLTVLTSEGSVLQTTYLPGSVNNSSPLMTVGQNGSVKIVAPQTRSFTPTRSGPFPAGDPSINGFLISLSATAAADGFPLACVGNGAGYSIQPISPGQLLSLFGNGLGPQQGVAPQATLQTPYPTRAGDVQVTFDGTAAPILWAQDTQVNVVAPWSLDTSKNTDVCVSYNGVKLKCLNWPTAQTAPGVFTRDDIPGQLVNNIPVVSKYAVALNQDGSVNSAANPAAVGSLVSVFATGLGPIAPAQADGSLIDLPLPKQSISVTVEGIQFVPARPELLAPTEVTYAGPAPYRVAGISQINFRLFGAGSVPYQLRLPSGTSQSFIVFVH